MAASPSKSSVGESYKAQSVGNFMVPIAVAWLLAVGGLLVWTMPTKELLERIGKLSVFAGTATAFLTVVLAAIQDALPPGFKQKLLFPVEAYIFPSYRAFSPEMLMKAERETYSPSNLEDLRNNPAMQNELWQKGLGRHRDHAAVAMFGLRQIAWRDTVPLLIVLIVATWWLWRLLGYPQPQEGWRMLIYALLALLLVCWIGARQSSTALVVYVVKLIADEKPREKTGDAPALAPGQTWTCLVTGPVAETEPAR